MRDGRHVHDEQSLHFFSIRKETRHMLEGPSLGVRVTRRWPEEEDDVTGKQTTRWD